MPHAGQGWQPSWAQFTPTALAVAEAYGLDPVAFRRWLRREEYTGQRRADAFATRERCDALAGFFTSNTARR